MAHPENPKAEEVLNQIRDLPRSGVVAQDSTGMIFLDIEDDYIFNTLEVFRLLSSIWFFPPAPIALVPT